MGDIEYSIKIHARARGVKISIHADGHVVVTKSRRISDTKVRELVEEKRSWILEKQQEMTQRHKKYLAHYTKEDFIQYKKEALAFATKKVAQWNAIYQFPVQHIAIRNQTTRWGSCTKHRTIQFNYKILFLPEYLADYLVVHELCHIAQMNHSQDFWDLVGKTILQYKTYRKELQLY